MLTAGGFPLIKSKEIQFPESLSVVNRWLVTL
jgi:hypothetical protein